LYGRRQDGKERRAQTLFFVRRLYFSRVLLRRGNDYSFEIYYNNTINMAEMWDTELGDVFVLFSSTLAVATGILCLHVQLHLLLLHREHQRREEGALLLQQLESRRISDSLLAEPLFYILGRVRQRNSGASSGAGEFSAREFRTDGVLERPVTRSVVPALGTWRWVARSSGTLVRDVDHPPRPCGAARNRRI
jgi:hypothetical protein